MRKSGYVSPAKAAYLLGVHEATVRNWLRALSEGRPSRLRASEVWANRVTGWKWITMAEVSRIKAER